MQRRYAAVLVVLLVVAGTVVPASASAATTASGGTGSSPAYSTTTSTNSTQLSVASATAPTAGVTTVFTVTNATGAPVSGATVTTRSDASLSATTNASGQAALTFPNATSYTVVANHTDTSATNYRNGTTTVDARKQQVQLRIRGGNASTPHVRTVGYSATYYVKGPNYNNLAGNFSIYNRTRSVTKGNGKAILLNRTGNHTLTASKPDTNTTHYANATRTVEVHKKRRSTSLSANTSSGVRPGDAVTFTFKNQSGAAHGTLHVARNGTTTNVSIPDNGTVTYAFGTVGNYSVTATENDTATVNYTTAGPLNYTVAKQTYQLSFGTKPGSSGSVLPNESTKVTVKDGHTGAVNVTLYYGNHTKRLTTTDPHVTFNETGDYTVTAAKNDTADVHYVNATTDLTVAKAVDPLHFSTTPTSNGPVRPNESVKVGVKDSNGYRNVTLHYRNRTTRLNGSGRVRFNETGNYTLTATKNDTAQTNYTAAGPVNVTVTKAVHGLTFAQTPSGAVRPGANATYAVKDNVTSSETNVTLRYGNETARLNGSGTVVFNRTGNYTVTATKNDTAGVRYVNATDDLTVKKTEATMQLSKSDVTVAPGQNVSVSVSYANNGTVVQNPTLALGDNRTVTGSQGIATFNYTVGRNHTVRTTRNDTETVDYHNDALNVTLSPPVVQPDLSVVTSSPSPNNATVFKAVESGSGDPIDNASLSVNGSRIARTNASGYANATFDHIGRYAVTLSKNTSNAEYRNDTANVTVRYGGIQLRLDRVGSGHVQAGDVAAFRVTKALSGDPVKNAVVSGANETASTDANGIAYLRFNETGRYTLTSAKSGDGTNTWRTAGTRVNVVRCTVGLNVTAADRHVRTGEDVTFNVTNEVTGAPVGNATLVVGNRTVSTDANGTATAAFNRSGDYSVVATHAPTVDQRFVNDTVSVDARNASAGPVLDLAFGGADRATTSVNETATGNLTLSAVPNGLSGFEADLTVENGSAASIDVSATNVSGRFGNLTTVTRVGPHTVRVKAVDLNDSTTAGDGDVHLATVAVEGANASTTAVSVHNASVDSENGSAMTVSTDNATVRVQAIGPVVGDAAPTNPNDDPQYEDVNGNGQVDFNDVVALDDNMNSQEVTNHAAKFDWNGNGKVDFGDVVALYQQT